MTENYLKVTNLTKRISHFELNDINFFIPKGYIMGLIGSNGAGKTTIIKLIINMLKKDNGQIEIFGKDHIKHEKALKQDLGVVFDRNCYVDSWAVYETEDVLSSFYTNWNSKTFEKLIKRFNIPINEKIRNLSHGMQTKLMLTCAFSHDAKLLILDEPTNGLDVATRSEFVEILQEYIQDGEKSVLFSTHITADLERIADYITYLENGNMIFTGSMEEFLGRYYVIKGAPDELNTELKNDIIGLKQNSLSFEGLISSEHFNKYRGYVLDTPKIDDIIVHINKEVR